MKEEDEYKLTADPEYQAAMLAGKRLVEKLSAFPDKAARIEKDVARNERLLKNLKQKILDK